MFPEWTWVVGFWIGAAVGSFLNVVVYRLPRGLSIGNPKHSFCTVCKKRLTWGEMIPLLSWVFQKGKCACGESKIPPRYFIVELVNGVVWSGIWYAEFIQRHYNDIDVARAVGYFLFASCLVAAIFTDIAHYIIPDEINAAMFVIGVGVNIVQIGMGNKGAMINGIPASLVGALTGIAVLWGIAFFGRIAFQKDAMGHGDIKMARGIGAVLLPTLSLASFGLAVALGALFGVVIILLRSKLEKNKPEPETEEQEEEYVPESIGSLLWCGLGYVLCIDIIGLFLPKFYEWWFKENPYAYEEIEEEPEVSLTTIPFGPYLAAGALAAMIFQAPLMVKINDYLEMFSPSK